MNDTIQVGAVRVWPSGKHVEVVEQVADGQFAGEFRYRYVADPTRHGILSAEFLLSSTKPAPTPAQDHGPLAAPLSDRTLAKVLSRPAHVPLSEMKSTRVFGFNVVTISPQGIPGGPRLDGVVSRQRAQDELDELEPFMVDGWKTVMVELREVVS